jgi:putative SOS response-associated peptidase YedK
LSKRRCIIPADAFYEWKRLGTVREPWCFASPEGSILGFAGLYEVWRPKVAEGRDQGPGWHDDWLLTCSIITTTANDVVAPVHDRMPVILAPADWSTWLDPDRAELTDLTGLLRPAAETVLEAFPVSRAVNNARLEGPELIERIEPVEQPTLFS